MELGTSVAFDLVALVEMLSVLIHCLDEDFVKWVLYLGNRTVVVVLIRLSFLVSCHLELMLLKDRLD